MRLFGIVDAARDPAIYPLVQQIETRTCLFVGQVEPEVAAVGPWLLDLSTESDLLDRWREHGWARNWGILMHAELSTAALTAMMRQRAQAILPEGDLVLFRFYDPRVWRNYIPQCDLAELKGWFDGIVAYYAPTLNGRQTLRFRLCGHYLKTEII